MNIYEKLLKVKIAGIKLQRDVQAYNYKYADLNQIQEKLGEVLQEQKLLVLHRVELNQVVTKIVNTENVEEFIESSIPMSEGTKSQDKGSEITYYRRYNLLSLLDLEVVDDDGKKAQDSTTKVEKAWLNDENIKNIEKLASEGKAPTLEQVKAKYRIAKRYTEVLNNLLTK